MTTILSQGDDASKPDIQVHAALGPEAQIDKREVEYPVGSLRLGVFGIPYGRYTMGARFQADREGLADVGLVVNDQDVQGGEPLVPVPRRPSAE